MTLPGTLRQAPKDDVIASSGELSPLAHMPSESLLLRQDQIDVHNLPPDNAFVAQQTIAPAAASASSSNATSSTNATGASLLPPSTAGAPAEVVLAEVAKDTDQVVKDIAGLDINSRPGNETAELQQQQQPQQQQLQQQYQHQHHHTDAHEGRDMERPHLFEVAFEVANKVGGIYTVLKTKSVVTVKEYGDRYCLIGPLSHKTANLEVERLAPTSPPLAAAIEAMTSRGVRIVYGRWLIEGYPKVLLFDLGSMFHRLNEWKQDLYNVAGVPSPADDFEMNDAIVFGYLVAWFLGEYTYNDRKVSVIAHFHEWLAGVGLVLCARRGLECATIFTTHATLLGRYLCAGNVDFYNNLTHFNVDEEAGRRGIYHRYCLERAAAHSAVVFTTVSHITAYESEHLLKRKPDGVTPNGLNVVKFSAIHEFQNLHAENKEKIHDFVRGHFYGHYDFDLDNTLYFFTAGRYEYRNKGVDMFVEALSRLNQRLIHFNSPITVVAFIIMPAATHSFTVEALKGQAVVKQLKDTVSEIQAKIGKRIFESAARGHLPNTKELMSEPEVVALKRRIFALKRDTLPPIVTHNMVDDGADPILNQLRRLQLYNAPHDRVKIIFHPEFLSSNNPLFNLDYEDFVRGCHLGVFPSYYEPWGYTPAECTVMGVPSISTNLSGFGCFMEEKVENPHQYGIYIIDRRMKSVEESIQQLADGMLQFCQRSRRQRINLRNRTERLSELLDWKRMGLEYIKARALALRRRWPEMFVDAEAPREETPSKVPRPYSAPSSPKMKATPPGFLGQPEEEDI